MLNRIKLLWSLFSHGKELRDKAFWAKGQAYVIPVVAALLVSGTKLAQSFGVSIPDFIDQETIYWVSGTIYMLVNTCITIASNKELGIGNASESSARDLPQESGGEAQQTLPEAPRASQEATEALPNVPEGSRFDEDVHARASEWLKRQQADADNYNRTFSPN